VGELVLITGTSSGIGLSAAVECAAAGHRVVATMRDLTRRGELEKAAAERGVSLDIEQLDVTAEGLAPKVRELVLKYGPIFALVNNAGIAVGGVFEEQSPADVRDQFETNVFGLFSVTRAVLPAMRAAHRGRIINLSSLAGRVALPALSIYAATKHAVEGFSESLRWEVEPFGIDVCLVEPGTFKTPMFFANQRRGAHVAMDGAYGALNHVVEKVFLEEAEKAPPPDAVGRVIAKIVGGSSPAFRTVVGKDARALVTLRRMVPDRLFATGIRRLMGLPRSR
jgi:NAD(P)-dependent dehydrogenase (short-subunit alcohol dehydrogenase family)